MTNFGKIFVVLGAVVSMAFAAIAMAIVTGGPNWQAEMNSSPLKDEFSFETKTSDNGALTYNATFRKTGQSIGSPTSNPADVVLAARKKLKEDLAAQQQQVDQEIATVGPLPENTLKVIEVDSEAIREREQRWQTQLDQVNRALTASLDEFNEKAQELQELRRVGQERRDEGLRLANQLDLLRTDLFSLQKQAESLRQELTNLEDSRDRLARRNAQLKAVVEPGSGPAARRVDPHERPVARAESR